MLLSSLAVVGNIGANIYNYFQQKQLAEKQAQLAKQNYQDQEQFLSSKINSNLTNSADFQNVLTKMGQIADQQRQAQRRTAVIAGGSPEAQALAKQADAQANQQMYSDMASESVNYKNNLQSQLLNAKTAYNNSLMATEQAKANALTNAISGVSSAMNGIAKGDSNTLGDDLSMFGLNVDDYERGADGHLYKKATNIRQASKHARQMGELVEV